MRLLCLLCVWMAAGLATAAESEPAGGARARLDAFLDGLETYTADFVQRLYDEYGELLETSTGHVAILRPGRFRWDYEAPYVQAIVTDGTTLWVYDDDLAQVTVSRIDQNVTNSPARLLGDDIDIDAHYDVSEDGQKDGLAWLRLVPKTAHDQYAAVRMGFDEGGIKGMRLQDNLGQTTEIVFSNAARNPSLDPAMFRFIPPPGVDVVQGSAL